jgi:hypothetical protein
MRLFLRGADLAYGSFQLDAIHIHISAAAEANDTADAAHAQHAKFVLTAGVGLFETEQISGMYFHNGCHGTVSLSFFLKKCRDRTETSIL